MATIDVRTLDTEFQGILKAHAPPEAKLEIVPSVQKWAHTHGLPEADPFRQATSFPENGLIIMVATLTENLARGSASVLNIGPSAHEALARNLRNYARFLLLHEIAHLHGMLDEKSADEWALARLNALLEQAREPQIES